MAHFAQIDQNNVVVQVVVVPDEQEQNGNDYLNSLGLTGTWVQTSYNANIRGKYAGVGDIYNPETDQFEPRPLTKDELAIQAKAQLEAAQNSQSND